MPLDDVRVEICHVTEPHRQNFIVLAQKSGNFTDFGVEMPIRASLNKLRIKIESEG